IPRAASFNGATAMKPWKRIAVLKAAEDQIWLQWGHGDEAVEENRIQDSAESFYLLQWGHGDEAVEESQSQRRKRHERKCFNGATAMKPWKRKHRTYSTRPRHCFNGATAMKPWKSLMNRIHELESQLLQWGHGDEAVEELAFDVKSNA